VFVPDYRVEIGAWFKFGFYCPHEPFESTKTVDLVAVAKFRGIEGRAQMGLRPNEGRSPTKERPFGVA
jgi:hypothetical protein